MRYSRDTDAGVGRHFALIQVPHVQGVPILSRSPGNCVNCVH